MLAEPTSERQFILYEALRKGADIEELFSITTSKNISCVRCRSWSSSRRNLRYKGGVLPMSCLSRPAGRFADKYLAAL